MEFIKSKRGSDMLLFNGFKYFYNRKRGEKIYWRCAVKGCKTTCLTMGREIMIKDPGDHNHAPMSPTTMRSLNIIDSMRQRIAEEPERSVQSVYSDVLSQAVSTSINDADSLAVVASVPAFQSIRNTLYRERQKHIPPKPKTRSEIQLPEELKTTLDGRVFLQADNGENDKILVFATDSGLQRLCSSETVYMDGAAYTHTGLFHQIFALLVEAYGKIFPVAFAFLPDSSSATYRRLFNIIKDRVKTLGIELLPLRIQINFELALMVAAREEFPQASQMGSLYHYRQVLWNQIEAMDGVDGYQADPETRQYIKRCAALAFAPLHELDSLWLSVQSLAPQNHLCQAFTLYFHQTWMDDISSCFPRNMWNQFENMGEESVKTNGCLESWHRYLKGLVSCVQPNIFKIIMHLKKEQDKIEGEMRTLRMGPDPSRSTKKVKKNVSLEQLREDYNNGMRTVFDLIDSCALTIHF